MATFRWVFGQVDVLPGGNHNIQFGCYTNRDVTTGSYNIAIGHSVGVANSTGDYQLAIGQIDDRWITGDSSFNVLYLYRNDY